MAAIALDDEAIDEMTFDAINALALIVQKKIGQTDGGIAGLHFLKGEPAYDAVREIIVDYLRVEESYIDKETGV